MNYRKREYKHLPRNTAMPAEHGGPAAAARVRVRVRVRCALVTCSGHVLMHLVLLHRSSSQTGSSEVKAL